MNIKTLLTPLALLSTLSSLALGEVPISNVSVTKHELSTYVTKESASDYIIGIKIFDESGAIPETCIFTDLDFNLGGKLQLIETRPNGWICEFYQSYLHSSTPGGNYVFHIIYQDGDVEVAPVDKSKF